MKLQLFLAAGILSLTSICMAQNTFPGSGNAGIGTISPLEALDVRNGHILVKNLANQTNESAIMIDHSLGFGSYANFGTSLRTFTENAGLNTYALQFFTQRSFETGQTEKLRITGNGNVLIGKTSQANAAYVLDVNGKARANEIVVNTTGADFVFDKNYRLWPIAELEKFVKQNKHLPEVPTAKAMQQEGVGVSELQTILLQKVEELTLYIIQQQKEINELKKKLNQ